ncbi:RICIN domain-containing protein [Lentzea sp. BCCO 10_0798]|uniref:RICIN domain-containing protein n=1 Tax=Lentzea kristufekii TaxID=3095430 RepID=A0ABU4TKZ1_9PSEU|nr:RICIN domain-containing protein [Lentzea sp. BCCO 10_0798]MDX8048952.1 RICIN domain-containing protein [Lentzea sp. BCCO 10_0798]
MNIRRKTLVVLAALGLALTASGGVANAAGVFKPIKNVGSGMCLQPEAGSTFDAWIVQMPCVPGSAIQNWHFDKISDDRYQIINEVSGRCFYMNGPVLAGSGIAQVACLPRVSNHVWKTTPRPPSIAEIRSMAGGDRNLCLNVPGGQPITGLIVRTWPCANVPAQRWVIGF